MKTLLWFQRDLRLQNNCALNWALSRGNPVIAAFVHSPQEDAPWQCGPASSWWLYHSLKRLSQELAKYNIPVHFFKADSLSRIPLLVTEYGVDAVCWTNRHEPHRNVCEDNIEQRLSAQGITVKRCNDDLLSNVKEFVTKTHHSPYKVFTPFYKRLRQELDLFNNDTSDMRPEWPSSPLSDINNTGVSLEQLGLLDQHPWHHKLSQHWQPGEASALAKLEDFIANNLENYSHHRDIPAIDGTTSLSPHLHFGEISPRQILQALSPFMTFFQAKQSDNAESLVRQLIWREFARYIMKHFPDTALEPMNNKFSQSFWQPDSDKLEQWQRGLTGIPIIDAGMRQLWETGWMHNRVRMLVASLLTKNLGIPWQDGARWFWHTLVDADLANNTMGWQWVAGCGVDAAPYFRIFNPYTQTERFDKNHHYINRWSTELHHESNGIMVIDVSQSRRSALERFKRLMHGQDKVATN